MSVLPRLPELQLVAVAPQPAGLEGARMSYMQTGTGPETVLLLHGIGSNCCGWRYMFEALSDRYRVVAWNAPGYYLSDNFATTDPTNWQYADALAALMDALGIESAHVAGSSFGSMVGASFAVHHPQRVRHLALLGASRGQKWLPAEERSRRLAMRDATAREGAVAMAEKRWQVLLGPNPDAMAVVLTKDVLMATHPRGLMQSARASDTTDVCEFAARIAAPTLVITGACDQVNPPEVGQAIAAAIPGCRMEMPPGIGHLPKLEAPALTARLLLEHFAA